MSVLDLVLLVLLAVFAFSGYRRGFIVGALGFAGFVGGGALGMVVLPALFGDRTPSAALAGVSLIGVLLAAVVGQGLATWVGVLLRGALPWQPVRVLDSGAGALLSAAAVLLVTWFLALAVVQGPFPTLTTQVRDSRVLGGVDSVMPEAARELFADFRASLDHSVFPRVFGALTREEVAPVGRPDASILRADEVKDARRSIVEIDGVAAGCREHITGSGFVVAPERVVTNAHVVAGVDRPTVLARTAGLGRQARVVHFDPRTDLAVLAVPGLDAPPLELHDGTLARGTDAVVAGFPEGGPFTAVAARVRERQEARGRDIYDVGAVTRSVYSLRAKVRKGNSGGPLLLRDGSVGGVVFAASADDSSTGYALTIDQVRAGITAGVGATEAVDTGPCT